MSGEGGWTVVWRAPDQELVLKLAVDGHYDRI